MQKTENVFTKTDNMASNLSRHVKDGEYVCIQRDDTDI